MFSNSCAETWRPSRTGGVYLFCLTHHDERLSRGLVWSSSPYCWPFIRLQRSAPSARGDESSPALRTNQLLSWFRVCAASSVHQRCHRLSSKNPLHLCGFNAVIFTVGVFYKEIKRLYNSVKSLFKRNKRKGTKWSTRNCFITANVQMFVLLVLGSWRKQK